MEKLVRLRFSATVIGLTLSVGFAASVGSAVAATVGDADVTSQGITSASGVATGTEDKQGQGVSNRPKPDYDPVGIRAGSFLIYPKSKISEYYDDNIYGSSKKTGDFVNVISPNLDVLSNWGRHALNFNAAAASYHNAKHTSQNYTDWSVGSNGRLDVTNGLNIKGLAQYQQLHEEPGSPGSPTNVSEPVKYGQLTTSLAINQRYNRVIAELGGQFQRILYDDAKAFNGTKIDESGRDRNIYSGGLKLGYDVVPGTNVYVKGGLNKRSYDQSPPEVALDRDSTGYLAQVGTSFQLSSLVDGDVAVGYTRQNYDSNVLKDVNAPSYLAGINWYLSPLTTVKFNAASTVEEADFGTAAAYIAQKVAVGVDHELLRNLNLSGNLGYENDDYKGVDRTDNYYFVSLGAEYLINRNFAVGADYRFTYRDSNSDGINFNRNRVGLTLRAQI